MGPMIEEATRIATRQEERPRNDAQVRAHLLGLAQTAWRTVMVAKPSRLAEATAEAWEAESRIATTIYSRRKCIQAAQKWRARIGVK